MGKIILKQTFVTSDKLHGNNRNFELDNRSFLDESASHRHNILSGEFKQHRLVEELVQGDVVGKALSSSGLDGEFSRKSRDLTMAINFTTESIFKGSKVLFLVSTHGLLFERSDDDRLVEWISRNNLPVGEDLRAEGLSLGMCSQISFEAERVDGGDERLDCVQRRASDRLVGCYVTTATGENGVDSGDAIGGGNDLGDQIWLHQSKMHLDSLL